MFKVIWPKTMNKPLNDEEKAKLNKCLSEANSLTFRPIYCLICKTYLIDVADDIIGHMAVKCQKCKAVIPINPAYFNCWEYMEIIKNKNRFIVPIESQKETGSKVTTTL